MDYSKLLVIDDDNYRKFAASARDGRVHSGYLGWERPGVPHKFKAGLDVGPTIPRSEWVPRIQAGQGTFLSDVVKSKNIPAKDQNGLGYCWVYGSTRAVEIQRCVMGFDHVELSPESVGGPCTGWRNEGGYASEAFNQIQTAGICEASYMDKPHSLQPQRWKDGWQDNAKTHRAIEWYEIGTSFDEVVTCLLNRQPVAAGLDWWGHLVCFLDVVYKDGKFYILIQNSWGRDWPNEGDNGFSLLSESRATPDGAAVPLIVTAA